MHSNSLASMLSLGFLVLLGPTLRSAEKPLPPIQEFKYVKAKANIFKVAKRNKPVVIRTEKEAAKYFDAKSMETFKKHVDWKERIVLVFAWRGSGQDRLSYVVAESFPEQVTFSLKPGRTKDLRPHVHVYVLRANVKWSIKKR